LVLREPAHQDGQEETKKGRYGRGEYTRDNVERGRRVLSPVFEEWDKTGNLRVHDKGEIREEKGMIRTEDKLARMESTKRGTVLRKASRVSRNQPVVFFWISSAGDLFKLSHIYADNNEHSTPEAGMNPLTISLGLGARVISAPFGRLFSNSWATMWAYGTAAMEAKP